MQLGPALYKYVYRGGEESSESRSRLETLLLGASQNRGTHRKKEREALRAKKSPAVLASAVGRSSAPRSKMKLQMELFDEGEGNFHLSGGRSALLHGGLPEVVQEKYPWKAQSQSHV